MSRSTPVVRRHKAAGVKTVRLFLGLSLLLSGLGRAGDESLTFEFTAEADLREFLALYERLAQRTVWVKLGVRVDQLMGAPIQGKTSTSAEAIALIRTTLLERFGIEIVESKKGEALLVYSTDPKYLPLQEKP